MYILSEFTHVARSMRKGPRCEPVVEQIVLYWREGLLRDAHVLSVFDEWIEQLTPGNGDGASRQSVSTPLPSEMWCSRLVCSQPRLSLVWFVFALRLGTAKMRGKQLR